MAGSALKRLMQEYKGCVCLFDLFEESVLPPVYYFRRTIEQFSGGNFGWTKK